ncbi:MAG: transposase [Patescibacteria group bacterium]|nr:transposase [Patescibacteria group bacterium]
MSIPKINKESKNQIHFLTLTTIEWLDIFTKPGYYKILIDSLKFCCKNKGLLIYEYVFMTNHIHLILQAKEGFGLDEIIRDFKRHTTREIIKTLEQDRRKYILKLIGTSLSKNSEDSLQIWQSGNYPEIIETENFLNQKIDYIHNNPVVKEYVEKPEDWFYSSAGYRLVDKESLLELEEY